MNAGLGAPEVTKKLPVRILMALVRSQIFGLSIRTIYLALI